MAASKHGWVPFRTLRTVLLGAALAAGGVAGRAEAQRLHHPLDVSEVVIDASSGRVLAATDAESLRVPASLTKLMTLYLTFEALRDHRITLDSPVPISQYAESVEQFNLNARPGSSITVEQAIDGIVTLSANDAATALGEMLGGSEEQFAQMMTMKARALGMRSSAFYNASGLPHDPENETTAVDMATLARDIIIGFPEYYHFFSLPGFDFHGRMIMNHDSMLKTYPGADGMKTGFTDMARNNIVTSAERDGVRLIGVVLHAQGLAQRDWLITAALNQGFEGMDVPPVAPVFAARRFQLPSLIATAQAAEPRDMLRMQAMGRPPVRLAGVRVPLDHAQIEHGQFDRAQGDRGQPVADRPLWRAAVAAGPHAVSPRHGTIGKSALREVAVRQTLAQTARQTRQAPVHAAVRATSHTVCTRTERAQHRC